MYMENDSFFTGFLHFTLDMYLIVPSVKQRGIKYHFCVFGMTRPGTEPQSPWSSANIHKCYHSEWEIKHHNGGKGRTCVSASAWKNSVNAVILNNKEKIQPRIICAFINCKACTTLFLATVPPESGIQQTSSLSRTKYLPFSDIFTNTRLNALKDKEENN